MMQFYSFDLHDPLFRLAGWNISFQIITLENVFGLDPESLSIEQTPEGWTVECAGLSWAGQQQRVSGAFRAVIVQETDQRLRLRISVSASNRVRAVKILLRDLPGFQVLDPVFEPREVPEGGLLDRYPNQNRLPLSILQTQDGETLGFRCEDPLVRAKRFAAYREHMGSLAGSYTFECIHEEDARHFATEIDVPDWIFERGIEPERFERDQLAFAEQAHCLVRWQDRADMPA